jgi:Regulator of chromosome condensation (RCC1) repeat
MKPVSNRYKRRSYLVVLLAAISVSPASAQTSPSTTVPSASLPKPAPPENQRPPANAPANPLARTVSSGGVLWSWGLSDGGRLGDGFASGERNLATQVKPPVVPLRSVIAGQDDTSFAIDADNNLWTTGRLTGRGSAASDFGQTQFTNARQAAIGYNHAGVVLTDGRLFLWGDNSSGQLGQGNFLSSAVPVQVVGLPPILAVGMTYYSTVALDANGGIWSWGEVALGTGPNPVKRSRPAPIPRPRAMSTPIDIQADYDHAEILTDQGEIWGFSDNVLRRRAFPIGVSISSFSAGPFATVAKDTSGNYWRWDTDGVPALIQGTQNVVDIERGYGYELRLMQDGTVYGVGDNDHGKAGIGTLKYSADPVQVRDAITGQAIVVPTPSLLAAGGTHSLAIRSYAVTTVANPISLKSKTTNRYLAPDFVTASLVEQSNEYAWVRDFLDGSQQLATKDSECLQLPRSQNKDLSGSFKPATSVFPYCALEISRLAINRRVSLGSDLATVTVSSNEITLRNRRDFAAGGAFASCLDSASGQVPGWKLCDAQDEPTQRFLTSTPLTRFRSEADLVTNSGSAQIAAAGKIFVRTDKGWEFVASGSLAKTRTSAGKGLIVLVTAAHNFHVAGNAWLFAPGADQQNGPAGLPIWTFPYGVFAFDRSRAVIGDPGSFNNDLAFVSLYRQVLVPGGKFDGVRQSLDQLFDQSRASRQGQSPAQLSLSFPPLYLGPLPNTAQLTNAVLVGYPETTFRGRHLVIANTRFRMALTGQNQLGFGGQDFAVGPGLMAKGASGGPFLVNGQVAGVMSKGNAVADGYEMNVSLMTDANQDAIDQVARIPTP